VLILGGHVASDATSRATSRAALSDVTLSFPNLATRVRINGQREASFAVPLFKNLRASTVPLSSPTRFSATSRTLLLRFIFSILRLLEIISDHKKVLPFFLYGVFEHFLPIVLLKNFIMYASWVTFPSSVLY